MSSYNHENFIEYAIESVIAQTYENFELIIVDDCSEDGSVEIINNWLKKDNRIKAIFHSKNEGIARTFNHGLRIANGDYILIMASDDMLRCDAVETCLNVLLREGCCCVIFDAEIIDTNNETIGLRFSDMYGKPSKLKGKFFNELVRGNFIMTGMVKRDILYKRKILFDERLKHLNDWLFWLDISKVCDYCYIKEPLYFYRIHPTNSSLKKGEHVQDIPEMYNILAQKYRLGRIDRSFFMKRIAIEYYMGYLNDAKNTREYLLQAWRLNPFNIKLFILYMLSLLNPRIIKAIKLLKTSLKMFFLRKYVKNREILKIIKRRYIN